MIDLDTYFHRIGYSGERTATLETLREIHIRHPQVIAFENLNPLLRWPVPLDAPSLEQKLLRDQRGGYCFEHNLLLSHVLQSLGFHVTGLAARVVPWNAPEGTVTPRGHMLLRVDLPEGTFVADVGFGGLTLTAPLRLEADAEQRTPHEPFRLIRAGEEFVMQARIRDVWKPLYRFDLQAQLLPDYEVANWYLSNHPSSRFVTNLIAARPTRDRRYALLNNVLSVHYVNRDSDRRILSDVAELRRTLADVFRIKLPQARELDQALGAIMNT